jgi:hypothetical protein
MTEAIQDQVIGAFRAAIASPRAATDELDEPAAPAVIAS